jgi:SOS response regulatory protein OraA/RecX
MTSTALRRYGPAGWLDEPQQLRWYAELVICGCSAREAAAILAISIKSSDRYKKDPRVKAEALRLAEERTIRITSVIDTLIEKRLRDEAEEISIDTLLRIRKGYMTNQMRNEINGATADDETINAAMEQIESSSGFAEELAALLGRQ